MQKIFSEKDGQIRGAVLRVSAYGESTKVLQRLLKYIYLLKVIVKKPVTDESSEKETSLEGQLATRPTRAAAERAKNFIQAVIDDDMD